MFFTGSMDRKMKVWNTLQVVDEYSFDQKVYQLHSSALKSTLVAIALDNGHIRLCDLNSGSSIHTVKAHHQCGCMAVQWSPLDSNVIASAGFVTQLIRELYAFYCILLYKMSRFLQ